MDHDANLNAVLQRLSDFGFHANREKIQLCSQRVQFLGYDVDPRGYALLSGHPKDGVLVMIGSSRINDHPSSMVGELQALIWSLRQCWDIVIGSEVVVQTDSQSAWMRLKKTPSAEALKDVRILRAFEWLTANWEARLTIEFLPGEENTLADLLSRRNVPPSKGMTAFLANDGSADVLRLDRLTTECRTAIEKAHFGHWGVSKTLSHLRRDGWRWVNDAQDVAEFVQVCPVCQRFRMQASPDR